MESQGRVGDLKTESAADTVEFYLRFGSEASTDTVTYYEVAVPLTLSDPRRRPDGRLISPRTQT